MGYPCETCCRKDAELLEIAQSEREALQAAVAELKAALDEVSSRTHKPVSGPASLAGSSSCS